MLAASVIASASMPDDSLSFTVPLSGLAKSRRARVSLPKITALLDDPSYAASSEARTPPQQCIARRLGSGRLRSPAPKTCWRREQEGNLTIDLTEPAVRLPYGRTIAHPPVGTANSN